MIESNTRTLAVLLASFAALVMLAQSAHRLNNVSAAVVHAPSIAKAPEAAPVKSEPAAIKRPAQLVSVPAAKCASTWTAGKNYLLVTPQTCNDVSIASITVAVSAKSCDASREADFQTLSNDTFFKGDYGFFVKGDQAIKCVAVREIIGKYI
jgi:hypothetical protein